ncbi:MAG: hypothetical protein AAGD06_25890 [Acidobacteriota bacterium]
MSTDRTSARGLVLGITLAALGSAAPVSAEPAAAEPSAEPSPQAGPSTHYLEAPDDPYLPPPPDRGRSPGARIVRGGHVSVQVNVDALGMNLLGDAANEPSIAVDPADPDRIAIGWRQFDNIASNFRQGGWAFSTDGGASWTAGVIDAGVFRSDPVLVADRSGRFFYNSLEVADDNSFTCDVFASGDAGASWGPPVDAGGGDKTWMTVDRTSGAGSDNLYTVWRTGIGCCGGDHFNRSLDRGATFGEPIPVPGSPYWASVATGPDGEVYVAGADPSGDSIVVARSTSLRDPGQPMAFDGSTAVDLGGEPWAYTGPNPGGMLGQIWIAVVPSGPRRGDVHVLASVNPPGPDPLGVYSARSTDGGVTWSPPVRVDDDPGTEGWQWFGTLGIAPGGRLDAVWNDTRSDPGGVLSVLRYAFSEDGGATWSASEALSPAFDPHLGWPQQQKLGDYYHLVSEDDRIHLAWAATFNGEQDVYYLRLPVQRSLFRDGFENGGLGAWSTIFP